MIHKSFSVLKIFMKWNENNHHYCSESGEKDCFVSLNRRNNYHAALLYWYISKVCVLSCLPKDCAQLSYKNVFINYYVLTLYIYKFLKVITHEIVDSQWMLGKKSAEYSTQWCCHENIHPWLTSVGRFGGCQEKCHWN